MNTAVTFDALVSLCKRRGFVYPSSEIYGGFSAIYDYGPMGVELKNNIAKAWWKHTVQMRQDVVGLDSAIFMHPMTWKASGHIDGFNDPQIDCRDCNFRMRADIILEKHSIDADKMPITEINALLEKMYAEKKIKCEKCGGTNLTLAKQFSLMVKSNLGSPTEVLSEENVTYLRPETCGGIYLNYKNIVDTMRVKIPFGIAQIGKAFRNEIIARQFIFRTREFEQMELQYFIAPDMTEDKFNEWKQERWNWYLDYGIKPDHLEWHKHTKLAHYAKDAYDITYKFDALGGFKEVEGIHQRGDWDLSQHATFSGAELQYFDESQNKKFTPHIIETSVGLNRLFLMFLHDAYHEETVENETRIVLKLDPRLSPVKVAIMPLQKKPEELLQKSNEIWKKLSAQWVCDMDISGSIGKRYRRQDEIGTPYCVTIDFDTIGKGEENLIDTVTVRERDSMKQERIPITALEEYIRQRIPS